MKHRNAKSRKEVLSCFLTKWCLPAECSRTFKAIIWFCCTLTSEALLAGMHIMKRDAWSYGMVSIDCFITMIVHLLLHKHLSSHIFSCFLLTSSRHTILVKEFVAGLLLCLQHWSKHILDLMLSRFAHFFHEFSLSIQYASINWSLDAKTLDVVIDECDSSFGKVI